GRQIADRCRPRQRLNGQVLAVTPWHCRRRPNASIHLAPPLKKVRVSPSAPGLVNPVECDLGLNLAQSSAHARHTSTRRRNRTAVGTEEWLRRGRTEKCSVRQLSCQLFVFKLNEGADGVSIAICAQKHRVQASICLHRLTGV